MAGWCLWVKWGNMVAGRRWVDWADPPLEREQGLLWGDHMTSFLDVNSFLERFFRCWECEPWCVLIVVNLLFWIYDQNVFFLNNGQLMTRKFQNFFSFFLFFFFPFSFSLKVDKNKINNNKHEKSKNFIFLFFIFY